MKKPPPIQPTQEPVELVMPAADDAISFRLRKPDGEAARISWNRIAAAARMNGRDVTIRIQKPGARNA